MDGIYKEIRHDYSNECLLNLELYEILRINKMEEKAIEIRSSLLLLAEKESGLATLILSGMEMVM